MFAWSFAPHCSKKRPPDFSLKINKFRVEKLQSVNFSRVPYIIIKSVFTLLWSVLFFFVHQYLHRSCSSLVTSLQWTSGCQTSITTSYPSLLVNIRFQQLNFFVEINFKEITIQKINFQEISFQEISFKKSIFKKSVFKRSVFKESVFKNSVFKKSIFKKSNSKNQFSRNQFSRNQFLRK